MSEKITDEVALNLCNKHNVKFINIESIRNEKKNKVEKYIRFVCEEHSEFGEQVRKVYDFKRLKKICMYCNHTKLKPIFKKEVEKVNNTIEVLSEYTSWYEKVKCKCKICGNEWSARPSVILNSGGCPKCGREKANISEMLSQTEIEKRITDMNNDIDVIGEYKGYHKPIRCKCKIDGTEWESNACCLINGTAKCPTCAKIDISNRFSLSIDELENRVKNNNLNIELLGEYKNAHTPIKVKCLKHNHIYYVHPKLILYHGSNGCTLCNQTKGEKKMNELLIKHGYNCKTQYMFDDCVYKQKLRFDAYDESNNIAFEYQGEQHYRPVDFAGKGDDWAEKQFELNQLRDNIKEQYCFNNNISLITIPYWEYENMECYLLNELEKIG